MKEIIKYHLLTEGRVDDIKKKYQNVPPEFIDKISSKDPSGNNKYLEWMMHNIYGIMTRWGRYDTPDEIQHTLSPYEPNKYSHDFNLGVKYIVKVVDNFHRNVDRLTPERVYEALAHTVGHIPGNLTIVQTNDGKNGIWEAKNINAFTPHTLGSVIKYIIDNYPSKSEMDTVRREQTVNIYEDDNIKIVAPQSYASSCMYGAETRWCTTSKTKGPEYFEMYTKKNMVLIYFIFKKPQDVRSLLELPIHISVKIPPHLTKFKKMALWYDITKKHQHWFDERDENVKGLEILKNYIRLVGENPEQEFKTIKNKINSYIASKDERSTLKKIIKRGRI